jgi:hypothetical protein
MKPETPWQRLGSRGDERREYRKLQAAKRCAICNVDMSSNPFQAIYHAYLDVVTCHEH